MTSPVLLYAVHPERVEPLPVPAAAKHAHEVFDDLPLGVYTGLRSFGRRRFLGLEEHLDRTERCMQLSGWELALDRSAVRRAIDEVVGQYPGEAFVRLDVLPEPPASLGTDSRILLCLSPVIELPAAFYAEGVRVEVAPDLHRPDPRIKTSDFVIDRRPYPLGRQDSFEHVLLDDEARILECTSSNFYVVAGGTVCTAGHDMLDGITRRFVLRLCAELEVPVRLAAPALADVPTAQEAFLTSSTRGVVPVVAVADERVGTGEPGPTTLALLEAYRGLIEREARPAWPLPG